MNSTIDHQLPLRRLTPFYPAPLIRPLTTEVESRDMDSPGLPAKTYKDCRHYLSRRGITNLQTL